MISIPQHSIQSDILGLFNTVY